MNPFTNRIAAIVVTFYFCAVQVSSQPCSNDISTNPYAPVNNQFVQMGNNFFPANGTDTHNPYLNNFNWYLSESTIQLFPNQVNWAHGFSNSNNEVNMLHPYGGGMPAEFQYLRPNNLNPSLRDFLWEDGWELLYMNLGYFPDMNAINSPALGSYYYNHSQLFDPIPSNIPYFVLYNRYRGLMRLIANVWYPVGSNYSNINVTLKFTFPTSEDGKLTGLLRNASANDAALSEPTSIASVHAPRFHGSNVNYTQWIVADFQTAYDPCSCQSQGELEFVFTAFNTLDVDIIGRSVALDVPINDSTYTTRDFLNMSDVNVSTYNPGTEIYQNMDRLSAEFEKMQLKYLNDLNAYNQYDPFSVALQKFGIKQAAKYLSGGLESIDLNDSLLTWVENDDWRNATSLEELTPAVSPLVVENTLNNFAEKALALAGSTFGFLATEIFAPSPSKPVPPAVPVATIEESVYKGTITAVDTTYSSPLIIPGSLPHAYPSGTTLEPNRLPVYNEILGVAALLEYPTPLFHLSGSMEGISSPPFTQYLNRMNFKLRFDDPIKIALNDALDIDYNKTKTYISFEIQAIRVNFIASWGLSLSESLPNSNFTLNRASIQGNDVEYTYISEWIPLEELNQMTFALNLVDTLSGQSQFIPNLLALDDFFSYRLRSVKMKLMHDLHFEQVGSSGKEINTRHVRSYNFPIFGSGEPLNLNSSGPWIEEPEGVFNQYITGLLSLGSETITTAHPLVHEVIGTEIFINAQRVEITGTIHVEPGYTLVIQALEEIVALEGASFSPNVHLRIKKDFYNSPVFGYADNATVSAFCDGNTGAYQANTASKSLRDRIQAQQEQAELEEITPEVEANNKVALYPNPANGAIQLRSSDLGISQVDVYDIAGRLMLQRNYGADSGKQVQMDIQNLQSGVYIVQIHCGAQVHKEKLVVGL